MCPPWASQLWLCTTWTMSGKPRLARSIRLKTDHPLPGLPLRGGLPELATETLEGLGLVPGPAGDPADPTLRRRDGLQQGESPFNFPPNTWYFPLGSLPKNEGLPLDLMSLPPLPRGAQVMVQFGRAVGSQTVDVIR